MWRRISFALAISIFAGCSNEPEAFEITGPETDTTLNDLIVSQDDFSGHVIVADDSGIVFNRVYGESNSGSAMQVGERWRWASVTKQLVAVAILQMVEEGQFTLDTPVSELLHQSDLPNATQITIGNLLGHTSGLINDDIQPDEAFVDGFDMRKFCRGPVKGPPGASFDYNNCDYVILGEVLEAVDGVSWFESLKKRIFLPTDMLSMSSGHDRHNGNETVLGFISSDDPAPPVALELYEASGGLVGTVDDLFRFDRALISDNLLKPETRDLMWRSEPAFGYAALGQWVYEAGLAGCAKPVRLVERRGAISGVKVLNIIAPDAQSIIIIFVNRENFDWGAIWSMKGFAYDVLNEVLCGDEN